MKLATWNVNSLRVRQDTVLDWLERNQPDVLCLQETKMTDQEFPEDAFGDLHYDAAYWGQPAYNGVAIISRPEMFDVQRGFPGEDIQGEPRLLAATIGGIRVYSVYVPNGQQVGAERYSFKLAWLKRLKSLIGESGPSRGSLLVCGDFNVAPADQDVFDPLQMKDQLLASPPERAAFQELLSLGLIDAFRAREPAARRFTWWDYRAGGWERNRGLRIDHILVTAPLFERTKNIVIDEGMRGLPQPSDHVPVLIEIESEL